jgi:hypothetical protein
MQWIRTELVEDVSLPLEKEKKRFCDGVVHGNLMNQTWGCDADEFPWERDRVQNGLILQMLFFSLARSGALVPTNYYPDLCLVYQDVEFVLLRMVDKTEKFGMVLTQRWRKGEKDEIDDK